MTPAVALRLGRVSNLPTVWTNALAGIALAGVSPWHWATLPAAAGLSLTYVGGMYLNDAFDRGIDAQERPDRPIPAGQADPNTVFAIGFGLLLGGAALLLLGLAAHDAALRPRLRTGPEGVTVRALAGPTTIAWPHVRARVRVQRRWGVRARTLELEDRTDDAVLVVLGRRELGTDPETVAEALQAGGATG
jgi:hypothetical protein